jgi:hypothetical protein
MHCRTADCRASLGRTQSWRRCLFSSESNVCSFFSFSFPLAISECATENSCVRASTIGCYLTASSDDGRNDEEKESSMKGRQQHKQKRMLSIFFFFFFSFSLFLSFLFLFFFCYKITSRVSFITWGYVVYAVHDNDVKSAQKISRGCHRLCVCLYVWGWTKAPGYQSHMSHEVFIIREKKHEENERMSFSFRARILDCNRIRHTHRNREAKNKQETYYHDLYKHKQLQLILARFPFHTYDTEQIDQWTSIKHKYVQMNFFIRLHYFVG